ncbi:MAG: hypothetical protein KA138_06155 [Saprospiraceae bacterium]|nr:hypothetical protein [Lewinellaceae bacterium]MBP6811080.1 hypothetical protein [Saprospiraceae bacterium]
MTKAKLPLLLLGALFVTSLLPAQDKLIVGVSPFTFAKSGVTETEADEVFQEVYRAVTASGRFDVVPRDKWSQVVQERELQKGEAFIDGKTVDQGVSLGAQVLFLGHVVAVDRNNKFSVPNPVFHLCAVDVATGKVLSSEVISKTQRNAVVMNDVKSVMDDTSSPLLNNSSKVQAAEAALDIFQLTKLKSKDALYKQVMDYLDEYHPLRMKIFNFVDVEGETVKSFQIKATSAMLKKGQTILIKETKKTTGLDGSTATMELELAQAKVEKFEGEIATCKVTKNGDKLFAKQTDMKSVFLTTKK